MIDVCELLAECRSQGIELFPASDGGLTIDAPQGVLTPEVIERLRLHKAALLAVLRPAVEDASEAADDVLWSRDDALDHASDESEVIDPPDPCQKCGGSGLWQSVAGDSFGVTEGTWRCMGCDPPTASRRLLARAEQLRRR